MCVALLFASLTSRPRLYDRRWLLLNFCRISFSRDNRLIKGSLFLSLSFFHVIMRTYHLYNNILIIFKLIFINMRWKYKMNKREISFDAFRKIGPDMN